MRESIICIVVYVGSLCLMSFGVKETPVAPKPVVCVEKATTGPSKETRKVHEVTCNPNGTERPAPEKPKVAK